jgi:predicted nucleic acid-binding protein
MRGIVLDTNVISEPRRPRPDPRVLEWYRAQDVDDLWLTTVVAAELLFGVLSMPGGTRRQLQEAWLDDQLCRTFAARILPFDLAAARAYADLALRARAKGRPANVADAQIAAVATVRGFVVATRNVSDFEALGVPLINPWEWTPDN